MSVVNPEKEIPRPNDEGFFIHCFYIAIAQQVQHVSLKDLLTLLLPFIFFSSFPFDIPIFFVSLPQDM